jgi:hypothetical protein
LARELAGSQQLLGNSSQPLAKPVSEGAVNRGLRRVAQGPGRPNLAAIMLREKYFGMAGR